jgi:predicted negative regulator of RcsB-dependent stress response
MNKRTRLSGFSLVEGIIILGVVVLLAGVGFVGWKAFTKSAANTASTTGTSKQSAEVITTKADLENAEKALNDLNFDDSDASTAESQANL